MNCELSPALNEADGHALADSLEVNTPKRRPILAPSIFGRYLLTDTELATNVEAPIDGSKQIVGIFRSYLKDRNLHDKITSVSIKSDQGIYSRDFLVLLGLIELIRNPRSHLETLDGGITFLISDLRKALRLTAGGKNTLSIRESITRLSNLKFSFLITTSDHVQHSIDFSLFNEVETGEKSDSRYAKRDWFIKLSTIFSLLLEKDVFEQTKYSLDELLEHRKSPLTIAARAHYQTVSYSKAYAKRVSTLLKNINKKVDIDIWRSSSRYRSYLGGAIKRLSSRISGLTINSKTSLLYLLNQSVTYRQTP